ncbi:preprotein translocase subunit SecY [Candidatus Poribacteria bacterium]|nr:preprotein translocase subunit SecY [Candidatus Poribacteria bacterium]
MIKAIQNAFKIPELRKRIIFTILLLVVYRLGAHITLPGIDDQALEEFFKQLLERTGNVLALIDVFSGGAFGQMTIFALGIQPYISASIIMQLLAVIVPSLEKLSKEPDGKKKITQYTRYGTVLLSIVQGITITIFLRNPGQDFGAAIVNNPTIWWHALAVLTLTAGTAFVMWLGEQITERGIGQGISIIITVGIMAGFPAGVNTVYTNLIGNTNFGLAQLALLFLLIVVAVSGTIFIHLSVRKIPVQYGKQIRGNKVFGGRSMSIPLRVNTAGMIPIIFAVTLMTFPSVLISMLPKDWTWVAGLAALMDAQDPSLLYLSVYAILIIGFTYFYTAVQVNPIDMADNLQKYGGFIPGLRPGKQTADYINTTLTRITLPGALFLAGIAVIPIIITSRLGVGGMVEGASVLIVVGVVLDTVSQIESYLTMRHYDGFLKDRRLKGRRGR